MENCLCVRNNMCYHNSHVLHGLGIMVGNIVSLHRDGLGGVTVRAAVHLSLAVICGCEGKGKKMNKNKN